MIHEPVLDDQRHCDRIERERQRLGAFIPRRQRSEGIFNTVNLGQLARAIHCALSALKRGALPYGRATAPLISRPLTKSRSDPFPAAPPGRLPCTETQRRIVACLRADR